MNSENKNASNHYNSIVEQYKKSKELPHRSLEKYIYFSVLGDFANQSILDLACGDGFYTRQFKQRGAEPVVGVDIAAKMIEAARWEEAREPLGIEYIVGDVAELGRIGSFDLVVASYLLNCAQTQEQLKQMCQTIHANLKPNGRFVTLNDNVHQSPETYLACERYGLTKSISQPLREGTPILLTISLNDEQFSFTNYHFSRTTYELALEAAGFKTIQWYPTTFPPETDEKFDRNFWQDFVDCSPFVVIECMS